MSPATRQNLEKIHKWAGLIVWPFLLLQAITGALIVDNEATSQAFDRQMFVSELRHGEADTAAAVRALPRLAAGEAYGALADMQGCARVYFAIKALGAPKPIEPVSAAMPATIPMSPAGSANDEIPFL